jgi:hypothetical protein
MAEQNKTLARADKPSGARLPWPSSDANLDRVMGTEAEELK